MPAPLLLTGWGGRHICMTASPLATCETKKFKDSGKQLGSNSHLHLIIICALNMAVYSQRAWLATLVIIMSTIVINVFVYESVRLCVCLTHISRTTRPNFLCMLHVISSGGVAIRFVLPVLLMMSAFTQCALWRIVCMLITCLRFRLDIRSLLNINRKSHLAIHMQPSACCSDNESARSCVCFASFCTSAIYPYTLTAESTASITNFARRWRWNKYSLLVSRWGRSLLSTG